MSYLKNGVCAAALLALCLPAMAINKCTGPDGKVVFQDAACPASGVTVGEDMKLKDQKRRDDVAQTAASARAAAIEKSANSESAKIEAAAAQCGVVIPRRE